MCVISNSYGSDRELIWAGPMKAVVMCERHTDHHVKICEIEATLSNICCVGVSKMYVRWVAQMLESLFQGTLA